MSSTETDVSLSRLIRSELTNIPLTQWGFFFPIHVAVWRFVRSVRPTLLGELNAGFDDEPYFKGHGAEWFVAKITNNVRYQDVAEEIMRTVASQLPETSFSRGFVRESELPPIEEPAVAQLRAVVEEEAAKAESN